MGKYTRRERLITAINHSQTLFLPFSTFVYSAGYTVHAALQRRGHNRGAPYYSLFFLVSLGLCMCIRTGFFSHLPKNSRNFFHENSRNRQIGANFGQILIKNSNFSPKIVFAIFGEKIEKFPETQGFLLNSIPKSVKHSRNRQFCKSYPGKKRTKKTCLIYYVLV